jgi:hypothetical protein
VGLNSTLKYLIIQLLKFGIELNIFQSTDEQILDNISLRRKIFYTDAEYVGARNLELLDQRILLNPRFLIKLYVPPVDFAGQLRNECVNTIHDGLKLPTLPITLPNVCISGTKRKRASAECRIIYFQHQFEMYVAKRNISLFHSC